MPVLTLDSAVLGLDLVAQTGTVRIFRQYFALEDAIGSHSCLLEANMRVTNSIPLGCQLPLTVVAINSA